MTGLAITLLLLGAGCIALACALYRTDWPFNDTDEHEDYEDRSG